LPAAHVHFVVHLLFGEIMAELILTDEDRKAATYLDWDDASIGRGVKKIALKIEDIKGENSISWCAGAMALIARAIDTNSEQSVMTVEGLIDDGNPLGDWEVTVRRVK
jgi:hypothetical protein